MKKLLNSAKTPSAALHALQLFLCSLAASVLAMPQAAYLLAKCRRFRKANPSPRPILF